MEKKYRDLNLLFNDIFVPSVLYEYQKLREYIMNHDFDGIKTQLIKISSLDIEDNEKRIERISYNGRHTKVIDSLDVSYQRNIDIKSFFLYYTSVLKSSLVYLEQVAYYAVDNNSIPDEARSFISIYLVLNIISDFNYLISCDDEIIKNDLEALKTLYAFINGNNYIGKFNANNINRIFILPGYIAGNEIKRINDNKEKVYKINTEEKKQDF